MEASRALLILPHPLRSTSLLHHHRPPPHPLPPRQHLRVSASTLPPQIDKESYKGPRPNRDWVRDFVVGNDRLVRSMPIYAGGAALIVVLLNRAISGVAPVADASSSQSRADILALGLAVTNILAGLVWLSIRPKSIFPVTPQGINCRRIYQEMSNQAIVELLWAWETLCKVTCCRSLVVVYKSKCLLQIGVAAPSRIEGRQAVDVDVNKLTEGLLFKNVMQSGKQSYLANLSLYPGKSELPFLPENTQSVILQPLGEKGIAIVGGDTIRGFTNLDQAWISFIADKLDLTLSKS